MTHELRGPHERRWQGGLARALAFGAGVGLILITAGLARSWWVARPLPWNDRAIRATVTGLSNEPDSSGAIKVVVFGLTITNDTDRDYRVQQPSRVSVMLRQGQALELARNAVLDMPPIIPAHDSVHVRLAVPTDDLFALPSKDSVRLRLDDIDWTATLAEREKEEREQKSHPRTVHQDTAAFLPRSLNGIVILDDAARYRIVVTKQWE